MSDAAILDTEPLNAGDVYGKPQPYATGFRVTLIRPPFVVYPNALVGSTGSPSLALALLGAVCLEAGHSVTAIDGLGEKLNVYRPIEGSRYYTHGLNLEECVDRIPADTNLIGITCMFSNEWFYHRRVVDAISERFPGVPIIMGGEHITASAEYVLRCCKGVAACALGEGEETLLDVIEAVRNGTPLSEVPGLVTRDASGATIRTAPRKRMRDIDRLPWPAWELTPIRNYLDAQTTHGVARRRAMPLLASRGCPYQCTFCSNPQMWGNLWNVRKPADVVAEIKYYREKYGADTIAFYDLTAVVRRKWILEFATMLAVEVPGITWLLPSGTRSEALDEEVLTAMRKAGCYSIVLAPESGSPVTLAQIKKKIDPNRMIDIVRACSRVGIYSSANMIFGFPDEKPREMLVSLWYIMKLTWAGLHDLSPHPFSPYPGSELHNQLRREGKIPQEGDKYDEMLARNVANDFTSQRNWNKYIKTWQLQFLLLFSLAMFVSLQFLFRPWRVFTVTGRLLARKPITKFERVLYNQAERYGRFLKAAAARSL